MFKSGKLRILIVEDDFKSRMMLNQMLSVYGMCDMVVNGKEAIEAFTLAHEEGGPYDLICMDIMMPEKDGHEALKNIRSIEKEKHLLKAQQVIIFMITALDSEKDVSESIRSHCSDYIIKPIKKKQLIEKIKQHGLFQKKIP